MVATTTSQRKLRGFPGTFHVKGEEFVILKKEYLEELLILMDSVTEGERRLHEGRTRSFNEFLKSVSKRSR